MAVALAVALGLSLLGAFEWPAAGEAPDVAARDGVARARAVLELAAADDARAVALLVPLLRERDGEVRVTAGRLLARRGAPQAVEAATEWVSATGPASLRLLGLRVLRDALQLSPAA